MREGCLSLLELEDGVKLAASTTMMLSPLTKPLMRKMLEIVCFETWVGKKAWYASIFLIIKVYFGNDIFIYSLHPQTFVHVKG